MIVTLALAITATLLGVALENQLHKWEGSE